MFLVSGIKSAQSRFMYKKEKSINQTSFFLIFYLASKLCHMAMVELIIMMYGCGRVVVLLSIFFYQNSQKGTVRCCEMKKENGISLCVLSVEGPQLSSASGLLSKQSKLWFVDTN